MEDRPNVPQDEDEARTWLRAHLDRIHLRRFMLRTAPLEQVRRMLDRMNDSAGREVDELRKWVKGQLEKRSAKGDTTAQAVDRPPAEALRPEQSRGALLSLLESQSGVPAWGAALAILLLVLGGGVWWMLYQGAQPATASLASITAYAGELEQMAARAPASALDSTVRSQGGLPMKGIAPVEPDAGGGGEAFRDEVFLRHTEEGAKALLEASSRRWGDVPYFDRERAGRAASAFEQAYARLGPEEGGQSPSLPAAAEETRQLRSLVALLAAKAHLMRGDAEEAQKWLARAAAGPPSPWRTDAQDLHQRLEAGAY